jgi:hypothetical protein
MRQGTFVVAQSEASWHEGPWPQSSGAQLQLVGSAQAASVLFAMPE